VHEALEEPAVLYVPGAHGMCAADAIKQYDPAGHCMHATTEVAAVDEEYVPAGHSVRAVRPAEGQYVPGGHRMQVEAATALSTGE
jgi:hypothetical protein